MITFTRKAALVVLMAATLPAIAQAQDATITGMVRSAQGDTLRGAMVRIVELNVSVATDARGIYSIQLSGDRARGQTYTLASRLIGYRPQSKTITAAQGINRHHFTLEQDSSRRSRGSSDTLRFGNINGKQLAYTVYKGDTLRSLPSNNSFSQHLYAPELIMQNQGRLQISGSQRDAILAEIYKVQSTATQVQWRVAEESEKLNTLLNGDNVPEAQVIDQARRLIEQETAVKEAQLLMLIRVRNLLTAEQRSILQDIRYSTRKP